MIAIIIISAVITDLFKEKIETSRVRKTVMFSLLKEYMSATGKIKFHDRTKQRSTTVNKNKNNRNRTSN